jgi:hypothetical protein
VKWRYRKMTLPGPRRWSISNNRVFRPEPSSWATRTAWEVVGFRAPINSPAYRPQCTVIDGLGIGVKTLIPGAAILCRQD